MATQHKDIPEAQLHEPKGASTAPLGSHYISNGAGSGSWVIDPYGWIYFENIASPYTLTYPSSYSKVAPTTTQPGNSHNITESTTARLTYADSQVRVMDLIGTVSVDQASGAARDLEFALYKNGTIVSGSKIIVTTTTAEKVFLSIQGVVSMSSGDYLEIYCKNNGGSGDVRVYTFFLAMDPH